MNRWGNQTTVVTELLVPDGSSPGPATNADGDPAPEVSLIVKFDGAHWVDELGGPWDHRVKLSLPGKDVFAIDAMASPPQPVAGPSGVFTGVGTVLFNMVVNPANGKIVAALGSSKIGVLGTAAPEDDTFVPDRDGARRDVQPRAAERHARAEPALRRAIELGARRLLVRELPYLRRPRQPRVGSRQSGRGGHEQPGPARRPAAQPVHAAADAAAAPPDEGPDNDPEPARHGEPWAHALARRSHGRQRRGGRPAGQRLARRARPAGDAVRRQLEAYLLAFDSNVAPIVGQQVTLRWDDQVAAGPRVELLIERANAGECDLVAKSHVILQEIGFLYAGAGKFAADRMALPPIPDAVLRQIAVAAGRPLTYTCAPPGSGYRTGIDRDEDGFLDGDERSAGSDPADPADTP